MNQHHEPEMRNKDFSVVAIGKTGSQSYPLVLIFGRENNGMADLVPGIAEYDPSVSSGSAFWNRAFTFLQRTARMPELLRSFCVDRKMGPVLFSNALPRPIPNQHQGKNEIRSGIPYEAIKEHIEGVFSLPVIDRVKAVVFSTGGADCFNVPRAMVQDHCDQRGIKFIEAPYFASRSANDQIDSAVSEADRAFLGAIVEEFRAHT